MAHEFEKAVEKLRFQLSSYRNEYVITSYPLAAEVFKLEEHKVEKAHNYYKIYR